MRLRRPARPAEGPPTSRSSRRAGTAGPRWGGGRGPAASAGADARCRIPRRGGGEESRPRCVTSHMGVYTVSNPGVTGTGGKSGPPRFAPGQRREVWPSGIQEAQRAGPGDRLAAGRGAQLAVDRDRPALPATAATAGWWCADPASRPEATVVRPGRLPPRRPRRPWSTPEPRSSGHFAGTSGQPGAAGRASGRARAVPAAPGACRGTGDGSGTTARAGPAVPAAGSTGPARPASRPNPAVPAPLRTAARTSVPVRRSGSGTAAARGRCAPGTPIRCSR